VAAGGAGGEVAALRPFATAGVATPAELAGEFATVADAILAATASSGPAPGLWERFVGSLRDIVSVRPAGPMTGNDPPAVVSRIEAALADGDLAKALAERATLPQAGKDASADWAQKAADRIAVDRLIAAAAGAAE